VQDTCSFARAERILGREYHGRFLIELLQNAADAWRDARTGDERTDVRIVVSEAPALLVANRGTSFPETTVIESLGQIGRSTKAAGQAIGHKGIGFKSVLELTHVPELYSGLANPEPTVAVRFDPRVALDLIRADSPTWDQDVAGISDIADPLAAVPILRYPSWVEEVPDDVTELAADGFDTVIRLPFNDSLRPDADLGLDQWLRTVRAGFADLTDQMLVLLGMFTSVEIEDKLNGTHTTLEPRWSQPMDLGSDTTCVEVSVEGNSEVRSKWRLYRRALVGKDDLAGELVVGVRLSEDGDRIVQAVDDAVSAPFHLFFPTRIASGLPFLMHGYFEVDAARTGFYEGSAEENEAILSGLAELVGAAVANLAECRARTLISLPDLLGEIAPPENPLAHDFRDHVLARLDEIAWVPLARDSDEPAIAKPNDLLVSEDSGLTAQIATTFFPTYIQDRTERRVPARQIGMAGQAFLASRQPDFDYWAAMEALFRPGPGGPWPDGHQDSGFRSLLDLLDLLQVSDRDLTDRLLAGLKNDPDSCLLPAVAADGGRTMLPIPDPDGATRRTRSQLVMARVREAGSSQLVPPASLGVAFLPPGLLDSEGEVARAGPLGVRGFTVDNVLDRVRGASAGGEDPSALLTFLWSLQGHRLVKLRGADSE